MGQPSELAQARAWACSSEASTCGRRSQGRGGTAGDGRWRRTAKASARARARATAVGSGSASGSTPRARATARTSAPASARPRGSPSRARPTARASGASSASASGSAWGTRTCVLRRRARTSEILWLGQIEVDSADFWTNRLLSSSSRRACVEAVAYAHIEDLICTPTPTGRSSARTWARAMGSTTTDARWPSAPRMAWPLKEPASAASWADASAEASGCPSARP